LFYTENAQGYGVFTWTPRSMKIKRFEKFYLQRQVGLASDSILFSSWQSLSSDTCTGRWSFTSWLHVL